MKSQYAYVETDKFIAILGPDGELLKVGPFVALYGVPSSVGEVLKVQNAMAFMVREHGKS